MVGALIILIIVSLELLLAQNLSFYLLIWIRREMTWPWMLEYNDEQDHGRLDGITPIDRPGNARSPAFLLST